MSFTVERLNKTHEYKDKFSVVKALLYLTLFERNIILPDNELNVLSLFSMNTNKQEVIVTALEKGFVKSQQSGENTISKLVKLNFLTKEGIKIRKISNDLLITTNSDFIASNLKLYNIPTN